MEKNVGFTPSAPSAPPSYEEAVGNVAHMSHQPNIAPYPVGPSSMPVPAHTHPAVHFEMTNQSGPSIPPSQSLQHPEEHLNVESTPKVRVTYQTVIYELGPRPMRITCPTCHASIKTTTIQGHKPSAHLCCIVLCLLGCCLCSCLPYCISSFMNVHHFCPKCKNYIGTFRG